MLGETQVQNYGRTRHLPKKTNQGSLLESLDLMPLARFNFFGGN